MCQLTRQLHEIEVDPHECGVGSVVADLGRTGKVGEKGGPLPREPPDRVFRIALISRDHGGGEQFRRVGLDGIAESSCQRFGCLEDADRLVLRGPQADAFAGRHQPLPEWSVRVTLPRRQPRWMPPEDLAQHDLLDLPSGMDRGAELAGLRPWPTGESGIQLNQGEEFDEFVVLSQARAESAVEQVAIPCVELGSELIVGGEQCLGRPFDEALDFALQWRVAPAADRD